MQLTFLNPVESGTVIGMDLVHSGRFVSVVDCEPHTAFVNDQFDEDLCYYVSTVDFSDPSEIQPHMFMHEPRSMLEFHAIPKRWTAYGQARVFKPQPTPGIMDPIIQTITEVNADIIASDLDGWQPTGIRNG